MRARRSLRVPLFDLAQLVTQSTHRHEITLQPRTEESFARLREEPLDVRTQRLQMRRTLEQGGQCLYLQHMTGRLVEGAMERLPRFGRYLVHAS